MSQTYTVKQVAEILGYSTNSIYTFLKEKRIKGVRVGKGRFRIPQTELDRLLLTSKATKKSIDTAGSSPSQVLLSGGGVVEPVAHPFVQPLVPSVASVAAHAVEVPSLFDWFIGLSSIVLGFSMFLFSRVFEEFSVASFLVWMPAIRMAMIAGGIGLLLSDVVGRSKSRWHLMFHAALVAAHGSYAAILWQLKDGEGIALYGILAVVTLLDMFLPLGGVASFALYVGAVLVLLPVAVLTLPSGVSGQALAVLGNPDPIFVVVACLSLALLLGLMLWWGYRQARFVFWIGMTGISVLFVALSLLFAQELYWGRALLLLVTAIVALFVPSWDSFEFTHRRDRKIVFTAFGTVLTVFLLAVAVVRILQTNMVEFAREELLNKVAYGRSVVETSVGSAKDTVEHAAGNVQLIDAVSGKKAKDAEDVLKALYDSRGFLKRVMVLSSTGTVLTAYPYDPSISGSHAQREYFTKAYETGKTFISDVFIVRVGDRPSLAIAAPIVSTKKEIVGVFVGFLDLDQVGFRLKQLASVSRGETIRLFDRKGRPMIDAGSQADAVLAPEGNAGAFRGIREEYEAGGVRTIAAHEAIESDGWRVIVSMPFSSIVRVTHAATILIFVVMAVSVSLLTIMFLGRKVKVVVREDSS